MERLNIQWECNNCGYIENGKSDIILEPKDWSVCPQCSTHHFDIKNWYYNPEYVKKIEEISRGLYKYLSYYRRFMPDILDMEESEYNRTKEAQNVNIALEVASAHMKVETV